MVDRFRIQFNLYQLFDHWVAIAREKAATGDESFMQRLLTHRDKLEIDDKAISYVGFSSTTNSR